MKRREVLPLIARRSGHVAGARVAAAEKSPAAPELRRVSYQSARTGKERDYFVYLPPGHAQKKDWPVMLFLHGDGERGDGKGELDYVLTHGPLFEAWCQKRDLPFIIISPQLPMFGRGEQPYIKMRTPASIPARRAEGINPRPDTVTGDVRLSEPMSGKAPDDRLPDGPRGLTEGWYEIEDELIGMVDRTVASFKGDPKRVYLTGLSYGGFGTWYLAAHHTDKFAAVAPIVGYGHPGPCRAHRGGQTTLVGVCRRARPGGAVALLLPGAQSPRSSRPSRGALHEPRRPRTSHLGAGLRR